MKKLNPAATRIFCRLLERLNDQGYAKLHSEGCMPLTIERLEEGIRTPLGTVTLYSLCHYYEQNGDLMRDPEMCFLVVGNLASRRNGEPVAIYPQLYRQDSLGLEEESIRLENGQVTGYIKTWQQAHCVFANKWLANIKAQGFLK